MKIQRIAKIINGRLTLTEAIFQAQAAKATIPADLFQTYRPHDQINEPRYYSKSTHRFYTRLANGSFVEVRCQVS